MTHPCKRIVQAAKYLRSAGMRADQLSSIHHFSIKGRAISFGQTSACFGTDKNLRLNNLKFARRIEFVQTEHTRTAEDFDTLVTRAVVRVPF